MKFTVQKNSIVDVLSNVQGLTGRKSNLAITGNILLVASKDGITIAVTDLETGFEGTYPASVETEGRIAINARKFFEIIREFPNDEILVNEEENRWIQIGNENIEYHIVGMNPDDFPDIPQLEGVEFFEINSNTLKRMIDQTAHVGSSDDKRAHIIGVFLEKIDTDDHHALRMVSTDGSRLSKVDFPFDKDQTLHIDGGMIVPKKGLNEVGKFLDTDSPVQIGSKSNHMIFKKESETIIIRLLEGEFPDYSEIIKRFDANIITLDRQLFLMMLKRMSILSSESYKGVIFNLSEDKMRISSTNPDIGDSKEEMPIEFKADSIEVAFNPRFFIETLNVMDEDKIFLNIIDDEKPCLVEGEKDKNYLSVIMPMRI